MAEIKIEKKKPIWPWILAVLAVLLVLWLIFNDNDDNTDDMETVTDTEQVEKDYIYANNDSLDDNNDEINTFVAFVDTESEERMGLSHNYTQTALERLADAVEAEAEEANVEVDREMERVNDISENLTEDKYAEQHADSLKVAFVQIANSIEKIQKENNAETSVDVKGLKEKAEALKEGENILNQKDAVNAYFDKAVEVLEKMNDNAMAQNTNGATNTNGNNSENTNQKQ